MSINFNDVRNMIDDAYSVEHKGLKYGILITELDDTVMTAITVSDGTEDNTSQFLISEENGDRIIALLNLIHMAAEDLGAERVADLSAFVLHLALSDIIEDGEEDLPETRDESEDDKPFVEEAVDKELLS